MVRMLGFPKISGPFFLGPWKKDSSIFELQIGVPLFRETTMLPVQSCAQALKTEYGQLFARQLLNKQGCGWG